MFKNCSCDLVCSTAIALNGTTSLQITIPSKTYNNGECLQVRLAQAIPSTGTPLPVEILMGTTAYPLLKPCGNNVMSDQLRTCRRYCLRVGTNPNHFTVRRCYELCGTAFVPAQMNPASAPAAAPTSK